MFNRILKLWDSISYSEGEKLVPFTLLETFDNGEDEFDKLIEYSSKLPKKHYFVTNEINEILYETTDFVNDLLKSKAKYIFESPDNGKTIYKREMGTLNRTKI